MNAAISPVPVTGTRKNVLSKHPIMIPLVIHAFFSSFMMFIALLPMYEVHLNGGPLYLDGWVSYASAFKALLSLDYPGFVAGLAHYTEFYRNGATPLYGFLLGSVDLLVNNMNVSMVLLNSAFSIGTLFVMKKVMDDVFHLEEKQALMVYFLYLVNVVVCLDFVAAAPTDPMVNFCIVLGFYFNARFVKDQKVENGLLVFCTNTLVLFSREIAWPFLLFSPALYFLSNVIKHYRESPVHPATLIKELSKNVYFSIILPGLVYLLFILALGLLPQVLTAYDVLLRFERTLDQSVVNAVFSFSFLPLLIIVDIKGILRKKESLPALLWIGIFVAARIIMPGTLWMHYWLPILFHVCVLAQSPITKMKSRARVVALLATLVGFNGIVIYTYVLLPVFLDFTQLSVVLEYALFYYFIL